MKLIQKRFGFGKLFTRGPFFSLLVVGGSLFLVKEHLGESKQIIRYTKPVPAPLPTKMRAWQYIVIHHSGSSKGNEEAIQIDHLQRGMENGMAYHFLIGNGSMGLGDGSIVEGHRWKYQLHGGHCHQDYLNETGIGVCLVGRFDSKTPTEKQLKALSELIYRLQDQFQIPDNRIHGHGMYYGEDSDCPGKAFPWNTFWDRMKTVYEEHLEQLPVARNATK